VMLHESATFVPTGSEAWRTFLLLSGMVIGGVLGLAGIGLILWPERCKHLVAKH
jgi:hypothetical protein